MRKSFVFMLFFAASTASFVTACGGGIGPERENEAGKCDPAAGEACEGSTAGECSDEADNDSDGFYDCNDPDCAGAPACEEADADSDTDADTDNDADGWTTENGDCDDYNEDIYPGADETCNGEDDDCDGEEDNDPIDGSTWYEDYDSDGYGDPNVSMEACDRPEDYVANDDDCNDVNDEINPDGTEIDGNGIDEDCDGYDFGEGCVQESITDAVNWISLWSYSISDVEIDYTCLYYALITDQVFYVFPGNSNVSAANGELSYDIEISTDVAMNYAADPFSLDMDLACVWSESCNGYIDPTPLVWTGQITLHPGAEVTASVNVDGAYTPIVSDGDVILDDCDIDTLDEILGYAGYDLLGFFNDEMEAVSDYLKSELEYEINWYLEYYCN